MPVNRVVSARRNVMVLAQPVADVFTPARRVITAMAKVGGSAKDLTATSRRLARYERLLSEIIPLVSPEVRTMIEEARDNDTSNGSETNETEYQLGPPRLESSMSGGPGGRIILPLPVPSPHVPGVSRSSTSSSTFEPGYVPPTLSTASSQTSQRLSPDSTVQLARLPSITAGGILIEEERTDLSAPKAPGAIDVGVMPGLERLAPLPTSPSQSSHGGWSNEPHTEHFPADSLRRDHDAAPVLPWLKTYEATPVPN
ncbi:hypothetical protein LTR20_008903 [Exophiala xenobiotica]|nr:hypothetical protein LTR40_004524 [Exophiala xenobiotica]KAK5364967.1 hypothetical protein LTS13_008794 [Exophiala xenobiotica]KAK5392651.1 hypothetical protein LTR79_010117 [Exophiala xenobiotica]KAK5408486.1 hypothetical protein LTR06_007329 [Exophiala xenobiotica]KAK5424201.1 hypothetical protein LTR90_001547 [Exophiala xenobiotica]